MMEAMTNGLIYAHLKTAPMAVVWNERIEAPRERVKSCARATRGSPCDKIDTS